MSQKWNAYARKTLLLEQQYTPKVRKVIKDLYSSFTSDLKAHGIEQAKSNLNQVAISPELLTTLTDMYSKAGVMGARLALSELKATLKEEKAGGFGRNNRWIQSVKKYLQFNLYEFAAKILNTTREDILSLLGKGIEGKLSIDQIVKLFTESTRPESRTRLIVRTEINRAANVGHQIGAEDFPYEVNKRWISAHDWRVRHAHHDVDNHVTSENGTFNVPVYNGLVPTGQFVPMQAPGDPSAPASLTINCRCRITFESKRDGQGNLIPRRANNIAPVIPLRATPAQTIPNIAAQAKALAASVYVDVK
jgi:hypothetical protein